MHVLLQLLFHAIFAVLIDPPANLVKLIFVSIHQQYFFQSYNTKLLDQQPENHFQLGFLIEFINFFLKDIMTYVPSQPSLIKLPQEVDPQPMVRHSRQNSNSIRLVTYLPSCDLYIYQMRKLNKRMLKQKPQIYLTVKHLKERPQRKKRFLQTCLPPILEYEQY